MRYLFQGAIVKAALKASAWINTKVRYLTMSVARLEVVGAANK